MDGGQAVQRVGTSGQRGAVLGFDSDLDNVGQSDLDSIGQSRNVHDDSTSRTRLVVMASIAVLVAAVYLRSPAPL